MPLQPLAVAHAQKIGAVLQLVAQLQRDECGPLGVDDPGALSIDDLLAVPHLLVCRCERLIHRADNPHHALGPTDRLRGVLRLAGVKGWSGPSVFPRLARARSKSGRRWLEIAL